MTRVPLTVWRTLAMIAVTVVAWAPARADAQTATAEQQFNTICLPCHTIGEGRRVGPDLQGVGQRRTVQWLLAFISSPQKMISSGDPVAVQLQREYTVVMPDLPLSQDAVREILAYIESGVRTRSLAAVPERTATPEDIRRGQDLFQGHLRFSNGGPTCNSCHHVRNDAVIGGGVLARELTAVFGRLGAPGIQAILGRPPFPVMEAAYRDKALTADEVFALVSFLQDADQHQAFQQPRDYGVRLLYSGAGGFAVLMGLFALFGRRRRKHPVFHDVFERQIRSQ